MSSHSNYSVHKEHYVVCIQNFAHVDVVSILVIFNLLSQKTCTHLCPCGPVWSVFSNLLSPHNYRILKKTCAHLCPCGPVWSVFSNLLSPHNYRILKKTCAHLCPCGPVWSVFSNLLSPHNYGILKKTCAHLCPCGPVWSVFSNLLSPHNYRILKKTCTDLCPCGSVWSVFSNLLSPHNYGLLKKTWTELCPCGCGQYLVIYCPHIITGYSKRHVQTLAHVDQCGQYLPYILVYKSNFLDVKMGSKNWPRLIFGRTWDIPTESQKKCQNSLQQAKLQS